MIMGSGLSPGSIKECADAQRQITRWDIDEAVPEHPVWLANSGLHHILVNTKALELAGITKDTPDLERHEGKIQRREDGEPTGYLDDFMLMDKVGRVSPRLSDGQLRECIRLIQKEMNENGVTSTPIWSESEGIICLPVQAAPGLSICMSRWPRRESLRPEFP